VKQGWKSSRIRKEEGKVARDKDGRGVAFVLDEIAFQCRLP